MSWAVNTAKASLLDIQDLQVHFPLQTGLFSGKKKARVYAVDGVNLHVNKGETLGIVGESGCGKTTTGLAILKLIAATSGRIFFNGREYSDNSTANCPELRREMQLIFQDPYSSLNPRMPIHRIIGDPMEIHGICTKKDKAARVAHLLEQVGLQPEYANRFPHEFSGGQRQRIGIARAIGLNPLLIVADEPVSALDVSIQAQTINLLMDIQERTGVAMLMISHDLSVVGHICDRVAVMYLGRVVESGACEEIFGNPCHPYTQALLSSIPSVFSQRKRERILLTGDLPSPVAPPAGCHFHPRCRHATSQCAASYPESRQIAQGHVVSCHLH